MSNLLMRRLHQCSSSASGRASCSGRLRAFCCVRLRTAATSTQTLSNSKGYVIRNGCRLEVCRSFLAVFVSCIGVGLLRLEK